jgi:hypothetical protein
MSAIFLALIQQLNASVFTLILILVIVFWLTYKSGGWVASYDNFENKSEKFDAKIDSIKDSLSKITATTELLYQAHISHLNTVKGHSPLSLTPKGEEISKAIDAEAKIVRHWDAIKKKLEAKNPINTYDIQVAAMDIARNCFDEVFTPAEQGEVKTYALKVGLNLLEMYPIIGIIIRNKIFDERNISLGEVDDHNQAVSGKS